MSGRLRACARSIYQALFPPPPKSLGTRLPSDMHSPENHIRYKRCRDGYSLCITCLACTLPSLHLVSVFFLHTTIVCRHVL